MPFCYQQAITGVPRYPPNQAVSQARWLSIGVAGALVALLMLSGCYAVPLSRPKAEVEEEQRTFEALIGLSEQEVLSRLGAPTHGFRSEDRRYFVYRGYRKATFVGFIIYIPIPGIKEPAGRVHCLLLEFNEGTVTHYEVKTKASDIPALREAFQCPWAFWSREELEQLRPWTFEEAKEIDAIAKTTRQALEAAAVQGDTNAAWALHNRWDVSPEDQWRWLCVAANGGYAEAQHDFGRHYQYGTKRVTENRVRAYMWYQLAAAGGVKRATVDAKEVRRELTAEELAEAERWVRDWKPAPESCNAQPQ